MDIFCGYPHTDNQLYPWVILVCNNLEPAIPGIRDLAAWQRQLRRLHSFPALLLQILEPREVAGEVLVLRTWLFARFSMGDFPRMQQETSITIVYNFV